MWKKKQKLECLVALCRALLHPQLIEEKFWVKVFLTTQDGMKHAEMHKKWKWEKIFWGEKKNSENKVA